MQAKVFKIERYSLHNGPGIRTTLFLKGCPLRCQWCGNPESQRGADDIMYNSDLCLPGCRECIAACPIEAIHKELSDPIIIARERCHVCGQCARVCPTGALSHIGLEISVEDAFRELCRDLPFYNTSDGGITISGGEPLQQPDFVLELLKKCKEHHIHTVLDTCGYGQWSDFANILAYTDVVFYDLKLVDPDKHKQYTGVSNELILKNLRQLARDRGSSLVIRVPLIPGINDSQTDIEKLCHFLGAISLQRVDILPYHRLGKDKYRMLERTYPLENLEVPTKAQVDSLRLCLMTKGAEVKVIV